MDLSVVMPTYNAADCVAQAIDSLNAQTYANFELIVVDDGSEDDTVAVTRGKLANDFAKPWQIIELGRNRGPSAARNVGLRAARGEWVQFLDSDDFLHPSKFELQMAYCAQAPADVMAVYSSWRQCRFEAGHISVVGKLSQPSMTGRSPVMCLVGNDRPLHCAGLARRTALEQVGGFDETLRFWEFEELTFRLARAGRLEPVHSATPLYLWRQHPGAPYIGGADARYQIAPVALGWIDLILKAVGHKSLRESGLSAADRRDILEYSRYWARCLFEHDRDAFQSYLVEARKLDPHLAPAYPPLISFLARHIGHEAAGMLAAVGWASRSFLRAVLPRPRAAVFE